MSGIRHSSAQADAEYAELNYEFGVEHRLYLQCKHDLAEATAAISALASQRAILRDSAKDVIAWCDANPPAGDALYCITRLRHAIAATETPNNNSA